MNDVFYQPPHTRISLFTLPACLRHKKYTVKIKTLTIHDIVLNSQQPKNKEVHYEETTVKNMVWLLRSGF